MASFRTWTETRIWKDLCTKSDPLADDVCTLVKWILADAEAVLTAGGTAQTDFTLHDAGHAFRVAERMVDIIPPEVMKALSALELGLLVLSAYLHDIGMTPEQTKVRRHLDYMVTGEPGLLTPHEMAELNSWLDAAGHTSPVAHQGSLGVRELRQARHLVTHYARHRHNDWSEQWIRSRSGDMSKYPYPNFLDDLVLICRSHHEGYEELVSDRFRPINISQSVVHLRYLAVVLRVADILEFDPERTPAVILRHREISDGSLIYWHKDHYVSLLRDGGRIVLSARPSNAKIHKAIETMVDEIDRELHLSWQLAAETHFDRFPGLSSALPHKWTLSPSCHRDIRPLEGTYEYIDGAFRPNTEKLLQLLSGAELYGSSLVAVRELLQNAFDAVREQIAWERLRQRPDRPELVDLLRKVHLVELRLDVDGDEIVLSCMDTGVGMTKQIIRDYLLVSGNSNRPDIRALERKCSSSGFSLERTGQFGIGVLSYFMLADSVAIRTRRSQDAGDAEPHGWLFETEGVGTFGELRPDPHVPRGTQVIMRIKREVVGSDVVGWYSKLLNYLSMTLKYLPCRFEVSSNVNAKTRSIPPGWTQTTDQLTDTVVRELVESTSSDRAKYPTKKQRQVLEARSKERDQVIEKAKQTLSWIVLEGELPDGLGRYRVHLPYFRLIGGNSLAFMDVERELESNRQVLILRDTEVTVVSGDSLISWKGMSVDTSDEISSDDPYKPSFPGYVDIDFHAQASGTLAIDRNRLDLSENAYKAFSWLDQKVHYALEAFCQQNLSSHYSSLNNHVASCLQSNGDWYWLHASRAGDGKVTACWRPVRFPVIRGLREDMFATDLRLKDSPVTALPALVGRTFGQPIPWGAGVLTPDRLVIHGSPFELIRLWTKPNDTEVTSFPPAWSNLVVALVTNRREAEWVWNQKSPVLPLISGEPWERTGTMFEESLDPLPHKKELLRDAGLGAAWLIRNLMMSDEELWEWIREESPGFVTEIWDHCLSRLHMDNIVVSTSGMLAVATSRSWFKVNRVSRECGSILPDPGPEWRLTGSKQKDDHW